MPEVILRKKRGPKPRWEKTREARIEFLRARIAHLLEQLRFAIKAYCELIAAETGRESTSKKGVKS